MSQPPPIRGFQSTSDLPQPTVNVPAVVSLVLGLLGFCIPLVAGLPAVVFGLIGLKRSRNPNAGGRGPAIAGVVLGAVSIVLWLAIAVPVATTWINSRPQKALARQFIEDLSRKDIPAAAAISASTLGWDEMGKLSDRLNSLGEFRDIQFRGHVHSVVNGVEEWTLAGDAYYSKDIAPFTLITVKQNGQWRVYRLQLSNKIKTTTHQAVPAQPTIGP